MGAREERREKVTSLLLSESFVVHDEETREQMCSCRHDLLLHNGLKGRRGGGGGKGRQRRKVYNGIKGKDRGERRKGKEELRKEKRWNGDINLRHIKRIREKGDEVKRR